MPYSSTKPNGTNTVLGVCVWNGSPGGVLAASGAHVYFSSGTSWTSITSGRTSAGRYQFVKYFLNGAYKVAMCDGVNPAATWDGTTYTLLNGSGSPTNPRYCTFWNGTLALAGYSANPQEFVMTAPLTDNDFTGGDGALVFNVSDTIVGLRAFRGILYIFCTRSIFAMSGNTTATYSISSVATGIGCLAWDSIKEVNGDVCYLSADGIRTLSGTMKLNDVELGDLSKPIINLANSIYTDSSNNPNNISTAIVRLKNQYRIFYGSNSSAEGIIGAIRPGKQTMTQFGTYISIWEWSTMQGITVACADSDFIGGVEYVIHGGYDGFVYRQESGNTFNGGPVPATYLTAPLQFDDPEIRKLIQKVTTYLHLEGSCSITLQPSFEFDDSSQAMQPLMGIQLPATFGGSTYGSGVYGTAVYGGGVQKYESRTNVYGSGRIIQFEYSTNDTNAPYSIQGISISYRPLGRR